ncbi:MAG: hypothetical protein IKT16_04825 [Desulfovibrio sp.]|nr:hypothetical protein [Desulfovibrio sp.]
MSEGKGIEQPADELEVSGFQGEGIRMIYDQDKETWFFSVVDVIGILTEQPTVLRTESSDQNLTVLFVRR